MSTPLRLIPPGLRRIQSRHSLRLRPPAFFTKHAFKHDEYYNDRFEIEPEASKFMNMFQADKSEEKVLPKEVYQPDEEVKELEAEVPYGTGSEEKAS